MSGGRRPRSVRVNGKKISENRVDAEGRVIKDDPNYFRPEALRREECSSWGTAEKDAAHANGVVVGVRSDTWDEITGALEVVGAHLEDCRTKLEGIENADTTMNKIFDQFRAIQRTQLDGLKIGSLTAASELVKRIAESVPSGELRDGLVQCRVVLDACAARANGERKSTFAIRPSEGAERPHGIWRLSVSL